MRVSRKLLATVATITLLSVSGTASAADLVTNGGFETGSFAGWTQVGNTGYSGVQGNPYAKTGAFGAYFGAVGSLGGISQNIQTVQNQRYNISFDLRNFANVFGNGEGNGPVAYSVTFGGQTLAASSFVTNSFDFTRYTFNAVATSPLTALTLQFQNNPSYFGLDNVSVEAAVTAAPEPATWAMMILGFGLIGFAMRRSNAKFDAKIKRMTAGIA